MIALSKFHSYGNDFLITTTDLIGREEQGIFARVACHPHFGIGADGCIFVRHDGDRPALTIYNRDGSEATMSGNGVRCASALLHRTEPARAREVIWQTAAGTKTYRLLEALPGCWSYVSDMGQPGFRPRDVPCNAPSELADVQSYELLVKGEPVRVNALFMGNPQCAILVDELPSDPDFERLGSALETHEFFPDRTNVSFVLVEAPDRLKIRIWERGVGPTCSSGTGSCGAAVAAIRAGRARSPLRVATETGSQLVRWSVGEPVTLEGEARWIGDIDFNWPGALPAGW